LSAPGWSRTSRTRATTTPSSPAQGRSIDSTSAPFDVSSSASSSADRSVGENSRSQDSRTFIAGPRSSQAHELLEEPDVAFPEQSDVRDAVSQQRHPLDAHAEREARGPL